MNTNGRKFSVAFIQRPVGLKGEVKASILTDFPENLSKVRKYYLGKSQDEIEMTVMGRASVKKGFAYFEFDDLYHLEEVDHLRGRYVFIEEKDLVPLPKNTVYIHDIVGSIVLNEANGTSIGVLHNVLKMPSGDIYDIHVEGKSVLVPAIEEFISEVNTKAKTITVRRFDEFV